MPAKSEAQRSLLNAKFGHAWVKKHHFDNKGKLPMKLKKVHKHTGPIVHSDMTSILNGKGGKDKHAHPSHHAANKAAGMPEGMQPKGGYDGGGCSEEAGGEGMEENCE